MSSPSPVQIREANAHLVAVHRRVADLEQRLDAAENTVREQAESLIRKDEQLRATTQEVTENKDREISFLQEKLCRCEETVQRCQQALKERESLIAQLQHRCHLLDSICKSRPLLDSMLAQMAEAERLGPLGAAGTMGPGLGAAYGGSGAGDTRANSSLTDGESNCSPTRVSNHKDVSLSEDDMDSEDMDDMGFGTTV
ncbi:vimentin-type intermediate filament-associated coiled-coil protein [Aplochiton taeniatus]